MRRRLRIEKFLSAEDSKLAAALPKYRTHENGTLQAKNLHLLSQHRDC